MKTIIIDNSEFYREMLRQAITKKLPYLNIIGEASSAKEGLELTQQMEPDLLLLDIQMGDTSGLQMLLESQAFNFDVVFMSGADERDHQIRDVKIAGFPFYPKGADVSELTGMSRK